MERKPDPKSRRNHDGAAPSACAGARTGAVGGGLVRAPPSPRQLLELQDRRLRAALFLMTRGCSVVLYGTAVNASVNAEHVLVGFLLVVAGAALEILTLGRVGRAADRLEAAFRSFF